MGVVTGAPVALFVGERCGASFVPPYTALGFERGGQIVAGAVFNVFTGPSVEVTVAALPGGISRSFIRACGDYVFKQLGCERATFTTESPEVAKLAQRLGSQTEGRLRNHFGKDRDGIVLGILKQDWKL